MGGLTHNWRIKASLFLVYFVFAILLNSVGSVISLVGDTFGVSKVAAATLEGFKDLPIAIVSFLVASVLPRFGFRKAMMAGLAIVAVACVTMPVLPSFLTTKMLFLCVGVSFALVKVSVYASVGLVTDGPKAHASFMNTLEGMFMLGVLAGYGLFGLFVDDASAGSAAWLNIYWLLALLAIFAAAFIYFTPFDEADAHHEGSSLAEDFGDMLRLMARPLAFVFVLSVFLYVLIEQGVGTWLPTFNREVLHLPPSMSIQATSIFAASLALGRFSAGALLARYDWYPVLNICVIAVGLLVVVSLPMASGVVPDAHVSWLNAPAATYVFPMIGLFLAPVYPAINSAVLTALPTRQHAEMTGLIVIFSALGGTTGSIITGVVFDRFDGSTAFYMALVPLSLMLVTLFFFRRETGRAHDA